MKLGDLDVDSFTLGDAQVDKVYLGPTEVWSGSKDLQVEEKRIVSQAAGGLGWVIRGVAPKSLFAALSHSPTDPGQDQIAAVACVLGETGNFGSGTSESLLTEPFGAGLRLICTAAGMQVETTDIGGLWIYGPSAVLNYTAGVGFDSAIVSSGGNTIYDYKVELEGSGFQIRIRFTFSTGVAEAWSDWLTITEV